MEKNSNENLGKDNKKTKPKTKMIIIIILAIVLAAVVLVICINDIQYLFCNSNNDDEPRALKPIIYLYPEEATEINVKLGKPENITCSYPVYKESGWNVFANTDGTLIDTDTGRTLYSLYWEGIYSEQASFEDGFVVKGTEVVEFLEEKLEILGLNEIEAEEFIVYWLPKLQENEYNFIRFATMDEINSSMPLEFSAEPDTIIRVLMQYKALDNYIEVKEQSLETPERIGFVAVEWGGSEIK